jgi:hypothetical protein
MTTAAGPGETSDKANELADCAGRRGRASMAARRASG